MTNSIAEMKTRCILVIGSNTPRITAVGRALFAPSQRSETGGVDPRNVPLARTPTFMSAQAGDRLALINGIMNVILTTAGTTSLHQGADRGFEELREWSNSFPPERAAEITGFATFAPVANVRQAKAVPFGLHGHHPDTTGVDNVKSLANLAMLTGNIGRESTGVNPLRGQNNVQGACDMGGLPNVYPAYQPVNNPDIQKKFEAAWNAKLSDKVGLTIPGVLDGLSAGTVKAVYVVGENPMVSDPDVHHVEKALRAAELLVVQDFLTPTADSGPCGAARRLLCRKDGTFSNTERRVQRVRKAIEPIGESRADWEILQDLSTRFGYPMKYESPAEIMAEVATVAPSYGGISYDRLEGEGLFWPCVNKDHPGTRVLHQGKFSRGLGLFHAIDFKPPAEIVDEEYPFWLTTRIMSTTIPAAHDP